VFVPAKEIHAMARRKRHEREANPARFARKEFIAPFSLHRGIA
jgi:hypothetical protein